MSDRICEAKVPTPIPGLLLLCGRPATGLWDYGCIHEHVKTGMATCSDHEPRDGQVGCLYCLQAGHECLMTFRPATRC